MKISLLIVPPSIYNFFSLGLNGAPFSPDFALVKWTDTSNSALSSGVVPSGLSSPRTAGSAPNMSSTYRLYGTRKSLARIR